MKRVSIIFLFLSLSKLIIAQVSTSGCTLSGGLGIYTACNNGQGCTSGCNLAATFSAFGPMCNGTLFTGNCASGAQNMNTQFTLPIGCSATVVAEFVKRGASCSNSGMDAGDILGINNAAAFGTNVGNCGNGTTTPGVTATGCLGSGNADVDCTLIQTGGVVRIWGTANRSDEIITYTINLSGITCGPSCNLVLPLTLTSFYAKPTETSVQLNWHVETEKNVNYYLVEKSNDGINFNPINTVKSMASVAGNNNLDYTTTDYNPQFGINYYRLTNIDNDGQSQIHKIIMLNFNQHHSSDVWINQTETDVVISFTSAFKNKQFYLIDMNGKLISNYKNSNDELNYFTIPKHTLPKGLYVMGCTDGSMPPQKILIN